MLRYGRQMGKSIISFPFYERGFSGQGSLREKGLVLGGSQGWFGKEKQYLNGSVMFAA